MSTPDQKTRADNDSEMHDGSTRSLDVAIVLTGQQDLPRNGPIQPDISEGAPGSEQRKKILRGEFSMRPVRPEEFLRLEDARWARQDPEVLSHYSGEFVVPYERKVVAHGTDAAAVLAEAAQITGRKAEELALVGVVNPLLDLPPR